MARVQAQGHPEGKRRRQAAAQLFAHMGDLESVLQLLPERVYAFCAGSHPRLGARSPVRLLPRPLLRVIARFAHEKIDINAPTNKGFRSWRDGVALRV